MSALAALFAISLSQQPAVTLDFRAGTFVMKSGDKTVRVPARPAEAPKKPTTTVYMDRAAFRKDDAYAVWDSRGLNIRKGERLKTTRLPEIALSPRIFTQDEIAYTRLMIALNLRQPWATGVVGARRIASKAYFLVRWDDSEGNPWLEALVSVDLSEAKPRWVLCGRLDAFSKRAQGDDNSMLAIEGRASWIAIKEDGFWGTVTWVPPEKKLDWKPMAKDLTSFTLRSPTIASFTQKTPYNSTLLGRADLKLPASRFLMETRGQVRLLDNFSPWLALAHEENGIWLHNLESGAKFRVPEPAGMRRASFGLLVWTPPDKPAFATLYDVERFDKIASWDASSPPKPEPKSNRVKKPKRKKPRK